MPHGGGRSDALGTLQQYTFDDVADLYDRFRPSYPEQLFNNLEVAAGLEAGDRVLEVGCGTGQATRPLAARRYNVLCLEPGRNLARLASQNFANSPNVSVRRESFESWRLEPGAFRLMLSAQAFHWLSEETRFSRASELLTSGGYLAVIGNSVSVERSPILSELNHAYRQHAPDLLGPPPMNWYTENGPLHQLFEASPHFNLVCVRRYPWSKIYSASDYTGLLSTHSDHRLLPESRRVKLHRAIAKQIQEADDRAEIAYEANLYVARCAA